MQKAKAALERWNAFRDGVLLASSAARYSWKALRDVSAIAFAEIKQVKWEQLVCELSNIPTLGQQTLCDVSAFKMYAVAVGDDDQIKQCVITWLKTVKPSHIMQSTPAQPGQLNSLCVAGNILDSGSYVAELHLMSDKTTHGIIGRTGFVHLAVDECDKDRCLRCTTFSPKPVTRAGCPDPITKAARCQFHAIPPSVLLKRHKLPATLSAVHLLLRWNVDAEGADSTCGIEEYVKLKQGVKDLLALRTLEYQKQSSIPYDMDQVLDVQGFEMPFDDLFRSRLELHAEIGMLELLSSNLDSFYDHMLALANFGSLISTLRVDTRKYTKANEIAAEMHRTIHRAKAEFKDGGIWLPHIDRIRSWTDAYVLELAQVQPRTGYETRPDLTLPTLLLQPRFSMRTAYNFLADFMDEDGQRQIMDMHARFGRGVSHNSLPMPLPGVLASAYKLHLAPGIRWKCCNNDAQHPGCRLSQSHLEKSQTQNHASAWYRLLSRNVSLDNVTSSLSVARFEMKSRLKALHGYPMKQDTLTCLFNRHIYENHPLDMESLCAEHLIDHPTGLSLESQIKRVVEKYGIPLLNADNTGGNHYLDEDVQKAVLADEYALRMLAVSLTLRYRSDFAELAKLARAFLASLLTLPKQYKTLEIDANVRLLTDNDVLNTPATKLRYRGWRAQTL